MKRASTEVLRLRLADRDRKRKEFYDRSRSDHNYKMRDYVTYHTGSFASFNKKEKMNNKWRELYKIKKMLNDGMNFIVQRDGRELEMNAH